MAETFTHAELVECAERELRMRRKVYPGLLRSGRLTAIEADHELRAMAAIVAFLRSRDPAPVPPPQGSLFG